MAKKRDPKPLLPGLWRVIDARLSALHKLLALAIALAAPLTMVGWISWREAQTDMARVQRQINAIELVDSSWRTMVKIVQSPVGDSFDAKAIAPEAQRLHDAINATADDVGVGQRAHDVLAALAKPNPSRSRVLYATGYLITDATTATSLGSSEDGALAWSVWTSAWRLPMLIYTMDNARMAVIAEPGPFTMPTWRALAAMDNADDVSQGSAERAALLNAKVGRALTGHELPAMAQATEAFRKTLEDYPAALRAAATPAARDALRANAARAEQGAIRAADVLERAFIDRARFGLQVRQEMVSAQRRSAAALGLFVLSLAGLCAAALAKSIMDPQRRLAEAMAAIAAGRTEEPPPHTDYHNEVGDMARSVEVFRREIIARKGLEAKLSSERKALEERVVTRTRELEAANSAKTEFVALLSHEIRTPLNGVLGMAAALARTELQPAQRDMLRVITASGDVLLRLLNNSIDIARIEAGEFELDVAPFDMADMVDVAASLYRETASAKGLSLDVQIAPDAYGTYRGDVVRLRQIIQNFVSNAVKFTDTGGVAVRIARLGDEQGRVQLRFEVEDTGIGLPPDAERLFKRYGQARSNRRLDGAGLGLAICRDLASLMGGKVRAHAGKDSGAVFVLDLALERIAAAPAPAPQASRPVAGARVLAAEDNPMSRLVLKALLEQVGVTLNLVEDGLQALDAARMQAFDVILMDVQMPGLDGLTAARAIRARTGPNQHTPILALSADAMPAHIRACRESGMNGHIAKPIQIDELFTSLADALAQGAQTTQTAAAAG